VVEGLEDMLVQLNALEPELSDLELAYFSYVASYSEKASGEQSPLGFIYFNFGEINGVLNSMWHGEESEIPEGLRGFDYSSIDRLGERFELYATVLVDENFGREVGVAYAKIYGDICEKNNSLG